MAELPTLKPIEPIGCNALLIEKVVAEIEMWRRAHGEDAEERQHD